MRQPSNQHYSQASVPPQCGLVMPISAIDGCTEEHWTQVREILSKAIRSSGFTARLVSDAADVGVIQKTIIKNLHENPVVVCDVSGKNPNVMFELGMRLAFDKPTIIVKDDRTDYSFDVSVIEHLEYPRDLNFPLIKPFMAALRKKIKATYKASLENPSYSAFLKSFGTFSVPSLMTKEVSNADYIIEELYEIRRGIEGLAAGQSQVVKKLQTVDVRFEKDSLAIRHIVAQVLDELKKEKGFSLPEDENKVMGMTYKRLHHGILIRRSGEIDALIKEALYSLILPIKPELELTRRSSGSPRKPAPA